MPALVTIGMPCFNAADHLDASLLALREQTHADLEILVADNASSDATLEIARAHASEDPRVTVMGSDENRGAAWNYNRLVDAARGELFKWAAHDDLCLATNVASCVEVLERRPEVVLAYPQTTIIDAAGIAVRPYDEALDLDRAGAVRRAAHLVWNVGLCNPVFGVIRTDVLRRTARIGSYDSSDVALLAELALHGRFVQVEGRTFLRRRHAADSRAANPTSRDVATWFSPSARGGRSLPLLRGYQAAGRRWATTVRDQVAVTAMFATVGPVSELRWHRRERRRRRAGRLGT